MKILNGKFPVLLLVTLLLLIITSSAFAESQGSGQIDTVLVLREDNSVMSIALTMYNQSIKTKNELYKYMMGNKGKVDIFGISSGDKYVEIKDYNMAFKLNGQNIQKAISNAIEVDPVKRGKIGKFGGFDKDGNPILTPIPEKEIETFRVLSIE